jgi:SNF2 family DNA or RNA helicase
MIYTPHPYQDRSRQDIVENPNYGLLMDLGLGKTVTTLSAIEELIYEYCQVRRVLVVAPKNVALFTWPAEIEKWDHTQKLKYTVIHGHNKKMERLQTDAQVYIINYDGLPWLAENYHSAPEFDMLVIDESTYVKNTDAKRFEISLAISEAAAKRTVILTGKPIPNGLHDIWAQIFLLDRGKRLGVAKEAFTNFWFIRKNNGFGYVPRRGATNEITSKIKDIAVSLKNTDYLDMPELVNNKITFELPAKVMKQYKKLETEFFLELENADIAAFSAPALSMKLRQFVSGFLYDSNKVAHPVHKSRLTALDEIMESLNGSPLLLAVQFVEEVNMIREHLKYEVPAVYSKTTNKQTKEHMAAWDRGDLPVMVVHPQSVAHGLNMQSAAWNIAWFSMPWSLDLWDQLVARLWRQGQKSKRVVNTSFCAKGTIEEVMHHVLTGKAKTQNEVLEGLKRYSEETK